MIKLGQSNERQAYEDFARCLEIHGQNDELHTGDLARDISLLHVRSHVFGVDRTHSDVLATMALYDHWREKGALLEELLETTTPQIEPFFWGDNEKAVPAKGFRLGNIIGMAAYTPLKIPKNLLRLGAHVGVHFLETAEQTLRSGRHGQR